VLAGVAVAVVGAAGWYGYDWWTNGRFFESTDDAYVGGNVTAIAPHVGGFIAQVLVGDNTHVDAGQLLIRLDDRDYRAVLDHAKAVVEARAASYEAVRARYVLQQATIRQQEADVAVKSAQVRFSSADAKRYEILAETSAGTRQEAQRSASLDAQMRASFTAASATLEAGRQQLKVLSAQIGEAAADLAQARSDLQTAALNLGYTEIRAPVAGYVGNRSAQVGAYVSAGSYLISVIPSEGLWVDANFKEDQLTHVVDGDIATIVADVLPGHVFHGHVASLAHGTGEVFSVIPAENATGNFTKIVQRVPVRVVLDANDTALRMLLPGLSTTASVDTRLGGHGAQAGNGGGLNGGPAATAAP
jgi:membrane fusion protein (multidrug efflux system)